MRILFLTSTHNSLSQRLLVDLSELKHSVSVAIASDDEAMHRAVRIHQPELIIAPMLKKRIPKEIWEKILCLIVHPGIEGDKGPSSIDWAIINNETEWGVSIIEASDILDGGAVWASQNFPLRAASKSSIYRFEICEAAAIAVKQVLTKLEAGNFRPKIISNNGPNIRGKTRPAMSQTDRKIDWTCTTREILKILWAADTAPGVLEKIKEESYFLYGGTKERLLRGNPGDIIAQSQGAICRATGDGAVWISHVKRKSPGYLAGLKVKASLGLSQYLCGVPELKSDYQEIRYEEHCDIGLIHFDFYNGAMSTKQCQDLLLAYKQACERATRLIILMGGFDYWSNGIDLNTIEAASDPALESWQNINAMNDLVEHILTTKTHLTMAVMRGNAAAGGVMLALACDKVFARQGIVLNPHYKSMGGLYGSEYWTYSLPHRVGLATAQELTESLRAIGTKEALSIGLIDGLLGPDKETMLSEVLLLAERWAHNSEFSYNLGLKIERRAKHERIKPLVAYREEELKKMWENFYGPDPAYHEARRAFVYKT